MKNQIIEEIAKALYDNYKSKLAVNIPAWEGQTFNVKSYWYEMASIARTIFLEKLK